MKVENGPIVTQGAGSQFNTSSIRRSFDQARNTLTHLKENLPSITETRRLLSNLTLATIATVASSGLVSADETANVENQAYAECPPGVYLQFQKIVSTEEKSYAQVVINSGYHGPQIDEVLFNFGLEDSYRIDSEAQIVPIGRGESEQVFDTKYQYEHVGDYEGGALIKGRVNGKPEILYVCFPDNKTHVFNTVDWRIDGPISAKAGESPSFVFDANQVPSNNNDTQILSRKDPQSNVVGAIQFPGHAVEIEGIGGKRQNLWDSPIYDVARIEFSSTDKQGETSVWWPPQDSDPRLRPVNDIGADNSVTDEDVTWKDRPWVSHLITSPPNASELPDNVAFSIKPPKESYSGFWNGEQWIRIEAPAPEITSMTFDEPIEVFVRPKTVLSPTSPLKITPNPVTNQGENSHQHNEDSPHKLYMPKISIATSSPR